LANSAEPVVRLIKGYGNPSEVAVTASTCKSFIGKEPDAGSAGLQRQPRAVKSMD
jgi:hypothetical protein